MHTPLEFDEATLFTPGRASYVTTAPDGSFQLNLTEASQRRSEVASELFDDAFHTSAVFAGGYPGIAQKWPPEHTPKPGNREADIMAFPLITRLEQQGWPVEAIAERILRQGDSTNSIGDVAHSIKAGHLDPNSFHQENTIHGLELNTGRLHGVRFRAILERALGVDPKLISRTNVKDTYGTPATEFRSREMPAIAIAKEVAAIGITAIVLKDVRPGELNDLFEAEQRFTEIALGKTSGKDNSSS